MRTLLLDTHVLQWWSAEPERLSDAATDAIAGADELAVAGIAWYELGWLAAHERIMVTIPISSWLARLAEGVRTVGITPAIAHTAVALPSTFPGDPADRLIFATAVECGWPLVNKDRRLRERARLRRRGFGPIRRRGRYRREHDDGEEHRATGGNRGGRDRSARQRGGRSDHYLWEGG